MQTSFIIAELSYQIAQKMMRFHGHFDRLFYTTKVS